jgi:glycosyltransferase involved in cell wall biosynthesis
MKKLKVALVHDYIKEYGGAERVLEALHEIFPDAPVYTSVYMPSFLGPHRERFKGWDIRTSFLQHIPFKQKLISPFRLLSPWVFKQFDLSGFDVIVVSATGAYFPNMIKTKSNKFSQPPLTKGEVKAGVGGAVHICYCHTPPRYLYGYATARDWKRQRIFAILGEIVNHFLRMVDFEVSRHVDHYIANSEEVAGRILKSYRKKAIVIYPPVEARNSKNQESRIKNQGEEEYYLTGGRLARAKHTDIILRACSELGVALKVFGKGFAGYEEELKAQRAKRKITAESSKLEFVGEVSDEEKMELMRGAKAFVFAAEDEDFGIVPVEAMAAGVPVIAYKSGGVKETVVEGETGVFFDALTAESLKEAIRRFEKIKFDPEACMRQAGKFSKERFGKEIRQFVERVVHI